MVDCFGAAGRSQVKTFKRDRRSRTWLTLQRDAQGMRPGRQSELEAA